MERLILGILAYHMENFYTEKRVNELVVAAIESSWDAIKAHKQIMLNVAELIVRDGIAAGEFEPVDPRETADLIMRSVAGLQPTRSSSASAWKMARTLRPRPAPRSAFSCAP